MKIPYVPERYFNYTYQFLVLIAVIICSFCFDSQRDLLIGALIGTLTGLPLQDKGKEEGKND